MEKIRTIFERDEKTRKVVDTRVIAEADIALATPTIKRDGMNVRVTIRNGEVVRFEARRNPNKEQKKRGIIEPWYRDANADDNTDKHLYAALANTDTSGLPDGEWPAEALGPKIQGNPMNLEEGSLLFFTLHPPVFADAVPTDYDGLRKFITSQPADIEGIVWHAPDGGFTGKLKRKDF